MRFTLLDWNIGGAKFLEEKTNGQRTRTRRQLNDALRGLLTVGDSRPDIVTLQEIVQYQEPADDRVQEFLDEIPDYHYFPFPLIDTDLVSSRSKWNKVLDGSDWHKATYFAQGNGFLVRKGSPVFPVWDLSNLDQPSPATEDDHFIEQVHLDSGLYFGDRNTEPRAALVMHLIIDPALKAGPRKPVDVFVVNVHLTTLTKEREGVPEIDSLASRTRIGQLEIVFNGIVSRYNSWRQDGYPDRGKGREPSSSEDFSRHSPLWILAGDFNFTEESDEYAYVKKRNFIDTVRQERKRSTFGDGAKANGTKAKGVGNDPTLTLDYVFAGPKFVAFDPVLEEAGIWNNRVIHDHAFRASDHYPIYSTIEFNPW